MNLLHYDPVSATYNPEVPTTTSCFWIFTLFSGFQTSLHLSQLTSSFQSVSILNALNTIKFWTAKVRKKTKRTK